ncbi:MAG: Tlg2-vesicle protein [Cirrosporium novae-zelandiae]|nr:MAG: Tlg2-vesicle protein [Cirrosporium novae-zelandiae]
MPADYSSAAQSLALPVPVSPSFSRSSLQPPWSRRSSSTARRSIKSNASFRDQTVHSINKLRRRISKTIRKLTPFQRVLAGFAAVVAVVLGILFLLFNEKIFGWLEPFAAKWKGLRGGWLILWAFTFIVSFPPLVGYSTCVTTAGFVYGLAEGTILSKYAHRLAAHDKRFAALALTLKHDGIKLLCMIRLCPLPYSFSNGALSTIHTVKPLTFMLATAGVTPKLLIPVFIGSRLAEIARTGEKMDAKTKAINYCSIIFGVTLGIVTGWLIYGRTVARARELEAEETADLRRATADGQSVSEFTDDPEAQTAAATLLEADDDDVLDFFDESPASTSYDDDPYTDDENVFKHGDGDEEDVIGLETRPPTRKGASPKA